LKELIAEKFIERTNIRILDMVELEDLSSNVVVHRNKRDNYISSLYEFNVRIDTWTKKINTNIRIDSDLVVIPCIMQITSQQNHILDGVNLGRSTHFLGRSRICDKARIPFVDPLKSIVRVSFVGDRGYDKTYLDIVRAWKYVSGLQTSVIVIGNSET
jgi:hypothetical protein